MWGGGVTHVNLKITYPLTIFDLTPGIQMIRFVVERRHQFLLDESPDGIPEHIVHPAVGPYLDPGLREEKEKMVKDLVKILNFENKKQIDPDINKGNNQ